MSSLTDLLESDTPDYPAIRQLLDSLDHPARLEQLYTLRKKHQAALYELCAAAEPITFSHFVPDDVPPLQEVVHHGKNTLPAFKLFEKRFCRPDPAPPAERPELFGYNEGATRRLIGPGYFVAHATEGNAEWENRGAIVVNYFDVPDGGVVDGWPSIKPNNSGLQFFVYNKTRDFMRKVSEHASIGVAYKNEKPLGAYFILCRE
ncbi:MAG: hypothetical protein ACI81R_002614 [Bradymonadia bacterium]|jgi:hypothetical protein